MRSMSSEPISRSRGARPCLRACVVLRRGIEHPHRRRDGPVVVPAAVALLRRRAVHGAGLVQKSHCPGQPNELAPRVSLALASSLHSDSTEFLVIELLGDGAEVKIARIGDLLPILERSPLIISPKL